MQLRLVLALLFVACITVLFGHLPYSEAASTQRPYQFGFTIDGQQHRQEKKDERGIVMGEFGFITADGIYHVTVYATDEEGKFRILAMRSYPYEEHPKTIEMIVRPKAKPTTPKAIAPPQTTTTTTTERAKPKPFEKHNFSVQGCSGCFLKNNVPTTTTTRKPEDKKYGIRPLSQPLAPEEAPQIAPSPPSNTAKTATTGLNAVSGAPGAPSAGTTGSTNGISTPKKQLTAPAMPAGNTGGGKGTAAGGANRPNSNAGGFGGGSGSAGEIGKSGASGSSGGFGGGNAGSSGSKPGSSGVGGFRGGSSGGNGAGETGDLYRFKYNLDYNGHRETGAYNGNKEGSFYAIGDDNVERTIEYIANEFGYQPRVRFRKLEVPVQAKENTLKDYEFVWFKKHKQCK